MNNAPGNGSRFIIRLTDVHKLLGGRKVLDGLTLSVYKGETLVIMGESGTGKSVTLKHIVGLMRPDSGSIVVDGIDLTLDDAESLAELRKKIGFLFQGAALLNSMNVRDNLALPLREHEEMDENNINGRIRECLDLVGLKDVEDKYPSELSGGMKKRVGLARAIIRKPAIILYDEPTSGLDVVSGMTINNLISNLQKQLSVTSVVVTHDVEAAFKIADRVALLHEGKILECSTPENFWNLSNPLVQQFMSKGIT